MNFKNINPPLSERKLEELAGLVGMTVCIANNWRYLTVDDILKHTPLPNLSKAQLRQVISYAEKKDYIERVKQNEEGKVLYQFGEGLFPRKK